MGWYENKSILTLTPMSLFVFAFNVQMWSPSKILIKIKCLMEAKAVMVMAWVADIMMHCGATVKRHAMWRSAYNLVRVRAMHVSTCFFAVRSFRAWRVAN